MQSEQATLFYEAVLAGEWDTASTIMTQLPLKQGANDAIRFLLLERKYTEQLLQRNTASALETLRSGLAPIAALTDEGVRLHHLASMLLSSDLSEDAATVPAVLDNGESDRMDHSVAGDGAALQVTNGYKHASAQVEERHALMRRIRHHLPPSLLLPEGRLEVLLEQALLVQVLPFIHCAACS